MQKGSFIFLSLRLAFCIAALCSGASWRLGAATVVVSSLGDSGIGSLRAAISAANPGDTVTFAVAGTITLTSGELLINKNLDINGLGGGVTVQRSLAGTTPNFRIFNITAGTVNILYLNMANGSAVGLGGAVQSAGSLTLVGCVLSGNKASVAGGGLAASGPTTVTGCTVWGNTANAGSGIYNDGTMIVNNTTIYRNSAEGVENGTGSLTLLHCTVSSNTNGVWNAQLIPGASSN